jgi:hypothetical protein
MHDQRTPAEQDDVADRSIMDVLIDDPGPWAVEELQREFLAPIAVLDSLNRLAGVGMIHRLDGFVFATRTAKQAAALFER